MGVTDNEYHDGATFSWCNAPPRKCRQCGREILDSEAARKLRGEWLGCSDCFVVLEQYVKPCEGCGRKVVGRFCNRQCRARYYNAPAAARRKAERLKARQDVVCAQCGKTFTPKRSDAKTCSNACRMKKSRASRPTTVINIRSGEPYDEYIGWQMPPSISPTGKYLPKSIWANPWNRAFRDGLITRDEACEKYLIYVLTSPELMARLPELKGKTIACWCKPEPCHGDVLVRPLED